MRIQLERYRSLHLSEDELCVAAAFLELPCLYGVSDRWMKRGYGSLYSRVMEIAGQMERKSLVLTELGGIVRMESMLYEALFCMGHAERLVRIGCETEEGPGRLYLYRRNGKTFFLEPDGRGGGYLGSLKTAKQLAEAMGDDPKWFTALAFERRGSFYETLLDLAWKPDGKAVFSDCLKQVAQTLWEDEV